MCSVSLDLGVALRAGALVLQIDPGDVEILHQRPVEHVDPDHRRVGIVAVIVPGAVRGQDQVAALGIAALALDIGVAAVVRQDRAAGVRAVDMRRRDVARIVDRDRAAHGAGHLQPAAEAGIGEQDALPVGELDRRHIGPAGDVGDPVQDRPVVLPAPAMRQRLDLVGGHAPVGHLAGAGVSAGIGEPSPLRRRIHLGADPDVELGGIGVELFHQFSCARDGRGTASSHRCCGRCGHESPPGSVSWTSRMRPGFGLPR